MFVREFQRLVYQLVFILLAMWPYSNPFSTYK